MRVYWRVVYQPEAACHRQASLGEFYRGNGRKASTDELNTEGKRCKALGREKEARARCWRTTQRSKVLTFRGLRQQWKGASAGRSGDPTEGLKEESGIKTGQSHCCTVDSLGRNKAKAGEKENKNGKRQLPIFILFEAILIFPAKLSS